MDKRLKNVEAATNIHGWLLTIDTMDYDEKYTPNMRLIRLIRDFFTLKSGDWTIMEIRYLHKAIKETGIEWKRELTLKDFASELIDEIDKGNQYKGYHELISFKEDYDEPPTAQYVIENIAVPIRDLAVELLYCNNLMKGLMGLQANDEKDQRTIKKGVSVAVIEASPKTYICPITGIGLCL